MRPEHDELLSSPCPLTSAFFAEMQPTPPGAAHCPACQELIAIDADLCPHCRCLTSPDGEYHGPVKFAPGATSSVIIGVVALFCAGWSLGLLAFVQGHRAMNAMANDPRLSGHRRATWGMVLGILAFFFFVIRFLIAVARMRGR